MWVYAVGFFYKLLGSTWKDVFCEKSVVLFIEFSES